MGTVGRQELGTRGRHHGICNQAAPNLVTQALHDPQLQLRGGFPDGDGGVAGGAPGHPRGTLPPVRQPKRCLPDQPLHVEHLHKARPPILQMPAHAMKQSSVVMIDDHRGRFSPPARRVARMMFS